MNKIFTLKNIIICLTILFLIIVSIFYKPNHNLIIENNEKPLIKNDDVSSAEIIFIDIKGAVNKPGVYQFTSQNMVIDAINQAGGLTKYASTKNINLSKKLYSEMVIYVFTTTELKKNTTSTAIINNVPECKCETVTINDCVNQNNDIENNSSNSNIDNDEKQMNNSLVNINLANVDLLQTLSGIGEAKAKAIILYRENNGTFKTIEEIKNVSGIGDSIFNNIKNKITI